MEQSLASDDLNAEEDAFVVVTVGSLLPIHFQSIIMLYNTLKNQTYQVLLSLKNV